MKNTLIYNVLIVAIVSSTQSMHAFAYTSVIDFFTARDLELEGSVNLTHAGVWRQVALPHTERGQKLLRESLKNPLTNVAEIMRRQSLIKALVADTVLLDALEAEIAAIAALEHSIASDELLDSSSPLNEVVRSFQYSGQRFALLNEKATALNVRHVAQSFTPVLVCAFEFGVLHLLSKYLIADEHTHEHKHGHKHEKRKKHKGHDHSGADCVHCAAVKPGSPSWVKPFVTAVQAGHVALHVVSMVHAYSALKAKMIVMNRVYRNVSCVDKLLQHVQQSIALLSGSKVLQELLPADVCSPFGAIKGFMPGKQLTIFSSIGTTLVAHGVLQKTHTQFNALLEQVGALDMYVALARRMINGRGQPAAFCFADLLTDGGPRVEMVDGWHVMFDAAMVTTNNFVASHEVGTRYILSGPNGSGKSSFLRTLGLNTVLAQCFGIAAAQRFVVRPFHKILSFMTIADDMASGQSSFIARMIRAAQCIEEQESLPSGQYALMLADDAVGQGTSTVRGEETAYTFVAQMGSSDSTILIAATHFDKIKSLGGDPQSGFADLCMSIASDNRGYMRPLYLLEKGSSAASDVGALWMPNQRDC
ncbi:MAG: mismatch repair protein MutS [Candidatus Dependentiae bacterium]|nr:mismatch repair protein MutS [Candidatus Dependentiae bacterium]